MKKTKPTLTALMQKCDVTRYALVTGIAKRAREISEELYKNNETLEEKPVKTAVEEIASGKCKIVSTAAQNAE